MIPRRPLGKVGSVSVLGFGASPLGGVFGDVTEEECRRAVHRAFELGINLFDTSPYYGATKSETMLGKCIQGLPREEIIVCTKVGRYGPEIKDFDFSAGRVTRSVHESLERLQCGYLDVVHCHDIEFGSLDQIINETLPALHKLRQEGLIRHVGISGLPFASFRYVIDRLGDPAHLDLVLSYCHHGLNDTSLLDMVPYFASKGLGVISASPLAMGLLSPSPPPEWHPAPPALRDAAHRALEVCSAHACDLPAMAISFSLREPRIPTTLVGMSTVREVELNVETALRALGVEGRRLTEGEEACLLKLRRDVFATVDGLTWPSGRPENN